MLLGLAAVSIGAMASSAPAALAAARLPPPPALCPAAGGVSFALASAVLRAAYAGFDAALLSAGGKGAVSPDRPAFLRALARLRAREYSHYLFEGPTREGERALVGYVSPPPPARYSAEVAPLLAALEGGGGEEAAKMGSDDASTAPVPPPIFDFAVWSLFKAIAAELPPSQAVGGARSVLNAECGRALARAVGGELLDGVREERQRRQRQDAGGQQVAPFGSVAAAFEAAMDRLTGQGYCCAWQVSYGDQPGAWPSDWPSSEPKVSGDPSTQAAARALERGEPLPLQLRVSRPADVGASVALRNEEWGFCPRLIAGVFAAFLEAGGYGALVSATVGAVSPAVVDAGDVYYAQDQPMERPSSLRDQLLLALGDPMTEVIVSFIPETEVQEWSVVVPSAARRAAAEAAEQGARVVAVAG